MTWSRKPDLKLQLQRLWDRGEILADTLAESSRFPLKLRFKTPTSQELTDSFENVKAWVSEIRALPNCRVVMREVKHRLLGKNSLPAEVWIDSIDDALVWLNRRKEFTRFQRIAAITMERQPVLMPWLKRNALSALEHDQSWEQILRVVDWMQSHPKPGIYLREVVIPGIHSKFIEQHASLLSELFDQVLRPDTIDQSSTGTRKFTTRYGFAEERPMVRFRVLDRAHLLLGRNGDQDIAVDWQTFADLAPRIRRVFITENKTNFLAFPDVPESMVIFGQGYGFEYLGAASWLFACTIHYWGDIDTHGFAALHGVRKYFPHIRSLMMDEQTIMQFKHLHVEEQQMHDADRFDNLTTDEQDVYGKLKNSDWGERFRLEQEHIDWNYATNKITQAITLETYDQAKNQSAPARLDSSDISIYINPTVCERRVYLCGRTEPSDEANQYKELLSRQLALQVQDHRRSLGALLDLSHGHDCERLSATVAAIQARTAVIYKPLLSAPYSLAGRAVQLTGEADFLILEKDGYLIRNLSLSRQIAMGSQQHSAAVRKAQLFAWLMEQTVDFRAHRLEILNAEKQISPASREPADLLRLLNKILEAKYSTTEPFSPVGWSKCSGCQFRTRCWTFAQEAKDVSLLPAVDQELARVLHKRGTGSIDALISRFDTEKLAQLSRMTGGRSKLVGKQAERILAEARAHSTGSAVWLNMPELPAALNWVVLDFEGLPPHLDCPELVYLFGMQVFGSESSSYMPSFCDNLETSTTSEAWFAFLKNAQSIFCRFGDDVPVVHWHSYEQTMIRKYIEKFGDIDGTALQISNNLIDLLTIVRSSVALPILSNSLKVVEKYIGFERSQKEYGGEWAIAHYLSMLESTEPKAKASTISDILVYNEEDLKSTFAVLTWLQAQAKSLVWT